MIKNVFTSAAVIAACLICVGLFAQENGIVRGPYLNMVSPSSVVIRWRTDKQVGNQVYLAREGKRLKTRIKSYHPVTDHEISLEGLQPATKYYYSIGSRGKHGLAEDSSLYFRTAPDAGSSQPVRIWALGDFGNGSQNQIDCLHAIDSATRDRRPDAWIWLGDNAYDFGKDEEYQQNVFKVYGKSYLRNTALYPSPGNHDYRDNRENGGTVAYYTIFTLPTKAETGGVASGTEAYYSVDYGNVHLVSLNSEEEINEAFSIADTSSAQLEWLKKDLAANKQTWTLLYLHRPPYTTSGSHNSDKEEDLVKMRENLVPLL
ncbi:MAG: metallophosphoesterase family protein, partial [Flavitalea sp.]